VGVAASAPTTAIGTPERLVAVVAAFTRAVDERGDSH
jgi:hypothetical protein